MAIELVERRLANNGEKGSVIFTVKVDGETKSREFQVSRETLNDLAKSNSDGHKLLDEFDNFLSDIMKVVGVAVANKAMSYPNVLPAELFPYADSQ